MDLYKEKMFELFLSITAQGSNLNVIIDKLRAHITWSTLLVAIALLLAGYIYWMLFNKPIQFIRKSDEIGFNHLKEKQSNDHNKVQTINRYLKIRNNGTKLPPPFPNGWFCVAMSNEIPKECVKNLDLLGQNLVIFRTESGTINVFDAYCPHLGANLGIGGKVNGECIECPFHLWMFRGSDGECVNIPYSKNENLPKAAKLKKWIAREANGGIFIWHHADNVDPWDLPIVDEIENGQWTYDGRNEFIVHCHIQEIPENGADVAHLNALHSRSALDGNDLRFLQPISGHTLFGTHMWNANWMPCEDVDRQHVATIDLNHAIRIWGKFELFPANVKIAQYGPALVHLLFETSFGRMVIIQTVVPVERLVQKVTHRIYAPRNLPAKIMSRICIWVETIMFERDMMVWNSKQYMDNPCLVKEDKLIRSFRKWYGQFYSESSRPFHEIRGQLDW